MKNTQYSYRPLINLHVDVNRTEEEMANWVIWCKEKGYGGFAMIFANRVDSHELPEDWFDKIIKASRFLAEKASKHGLEVWIFDEWGYPSGVAGGLVCENKELRAKKLHISYDRFIEPGETISITIPDRLVSLKSIPVNRFGFYAPAGECVDIINIDYFKKGDTITYTAGDSNERVMLVTWEYISFITHVPVINDPKNIRLGTPDLLDINATKKFTEVVHDKLYEGLKEYFGTVIKGFFYDEPELCFDFPWTEGLEKEFIKRKGYDLRDNIPIMMAYAGIFYHPGYNDADRLIKKLTSDYFDVWTDMLSENFYGYLQEYCHEKGVLSVGHQDMDNHTKTLASVSGHFFKNNKYNDSPGIDVIGNNIDIEGFYDFPRFAGSASRLMGKDLTLSETFAIMGIAYSPDRLRYVMEHQVIRGVNKFFNMTSDLFYEDDTYMLFRPGNYINEIHGRNVNDHVALTAEYANMGIPGSDLAVYVPIKDIYLSLIRDNDAHNMNSIIPWQQVDRIAEILTYMPCDFDYIWDEAIMDLAINNGFVTPKGQVIRTVILPPGVTLDIEVKNRLVEFVNKGGNVISVFQRYDDCFTLCPDFYLLKEYIKPTVKLLGIDKRISMCVRRDTDRMIYLFLNESTKAIETNISFRVVNDEFNAYSVDLKNGDIYQEDIKCFNNECNISSKFEPCEIKCFLVTLKELNYKKHKRLKLSKDTIKCVTIILPDGKRYITDAKKIPSWEELGYPTYSGFMEYEIEFDWAGGALSVDFGKVKYAIIWSLDKQINPLKEGNIVSFAPFIVDIGEVTEGKHIMHVYVQNTTVNRYIGTSDREKTSDIGSRIDSDRKMLLSGLFGEVRFFEEEK